MIWAAIGCLGMLAALLSKGSTARALWLIAAGYLGVQVFKHPAFLGHEFAAFFLTWATIAGAILRIDVNSRQVVTISGLTLISAMCYAAGAVSGQDFAVTGSRFASVLFWADVALIGAIVFGGWRGFVDCGAAVSGRLGALALGFGRCRGADLSSNHHRGTEASEKA